MFKIKATSNGYMVNNETVMMTVSSEGDVKGFIGTQTGMVYVPCHNPKGGAWVKLA